MSPQQKTNWQKIGAILAVVASAYGIVAHIRSDIQANADSIRKQATEEATRQAERNAYRLKVEERFEDLEKRVHELEIKKH